MTALTPPLAAWDLTTLAELRALPDTRPAAAAERRCGQWSTSAGRCSTPGARLYLVGPRCPEHTPAALAGEAEPGAAAYCPLARCWCGRCVIAEAQVSAP
ncbi:hypothetical protein ABZU32_35655 [Sphaerisporangium sp. NPDC005288]|uniref:hypothetical protein n=1 Tax=Sphaerisporangium sp. NPDC005288 TaxID=3155114 RepID=UPI0033A4B385